tara:strand:- start:15717 stop:16703 length:987 start_codon:yes stop_codon:yes gene_type:complete
MKTDSSITAHTQTHIPVMLPEVIAILDPKPGGIYVDGTFGSGGYARAILDSTACKIIGIDRDPSAIAAARTMYDEYNGRLCLKEGRISDMEAIVNSETTEQVDGVALDLGVSSTQLNDRARGFSFILDGPLDMRMGRSEETAADIVNLRTEKDLIKILRNYGEERYAKRIALAICENRRKSPIRTTSQLAEIVRKVLSGKNSSIDQATRTFQALRIAVNDEINQLKCALIAAERLLKSGGRLAVVSFHSLEDREVKNFLKSRSGLSSRANRHIPEFATKMPDPSFNLISRGVYKPTSEEVATNPRARSARLRGAQRTCAAAISEEMII